MRKGKSTHTYTDKDHNHKLIKCLKTFGYTDIVLVYSPTKTEHCGWDLLTSNFGAKWLGFTITEARRKIFIDHEMRHGRQTISLTTP